MIKNFLIVGFILLSTVVSCQKDKSTTEANEMVLTLGAYTVPKEVYQKEIIPAFQSYWLAKTGQQVKFQESYIASGAQSRAIAGGFEADIAALSLEKDIDRLKDIGLITHDWKNRIYKGFVTRSVVAIAFRAGNPKNIKDWEDLTKPGISVLYPSPKTSGGAMWDVNAIYGAGLKYSEAKTGTADTVYAKNLLKSVQRNVKVMDKSGRESVTTFENGIGDALVTYENEILLRIKQGKEIPYVIPDATILIENPIAVIDINVDKHQNRTVAEAFVQFLFTKEVQRAFARYGFRPVDDEIATEFSQQYPQPKYLFDIDYLGGWNTVHESIYGTNGVWTKIMEELGNEK